LNELAQTVFRIATNKGYLEIEADDEDLEITVKQAGKVAVAEVVNKRTKRGFQLTAQDGEIEVVERTPDGMRSKTTRFELSRGGKIRFTARMLLDDALPPGPTVFARIDPKQKLITDAGVLREGDALRIEAKTERNVPLFLVKPPVMDECFIFYRAQLKTSEVRGRAYLEMWVKFPEGEFFSKGLHNAVSGTTDWATYEISFRLEKGQRPESIKLGVNVDGRGMVWIRDITLSKLPLKGAAEK